MGLLSPKEVSPRLLKALGPDLDTSQLALGDFLTVRVSRLSRLMSRYTKQLLAQDFGLTLPEWRCLSLLCEQDGMTAAQLCRDTDYDKSQVSRVLHSLADRALLERPPQGAKAVPLVVTPKGLALFGQVIPASRQRQRDLLAHLSPTHRQNLYEAMAALTRALADDPDLPDDDGPSR